MADSSLVLSLVLFVGETVLQLVAGSEMAAICLHLFIYLLNQYNDLAFCLLPVYCSIHLQRWQSVLLLFVILRGLCQLIGVYIGLYKLSLANSTFPIALISIYWAMVTANVSEVVDCGHAYSPILISFQATWMCLCRRWIAKLQLFSIIILLSVNLMVCIPEYSSVIIVYSWAGNIIT